MMLSDKRCGLYEERHEHDGCGIGAVVDTAGRTSHSILEHAREILVNLSHRGAAGSDNTTGDGAGIMLQIPYGFLCSEADRLGVELPARGEYGLGMVFLPRAWEQRQRCQGLLTAALAEQGLAARAWREVPTDRSSLGELARASEPVVRQVLVTGEGLAGEELERRLFLARKIAENEVRRACDGGAEGFYLCSLSARTVVYKGMLMAEQLFAYYPDLGDEAVETALALVHQRYSTREHFFHRLGCLSSYTCVR